MAAVVQKRIDFIHSKKTAMIWIFGHFVSYFNRLFRNNFIYFFYFFLYTIQVSQATSIKLYDCSPQKEQQKRKL